MEALNRMHQFCVDHYVIRKISIKKDLNSIYDQNGKQIDVNEDKILKMLKNNPNRKLSEHKDLLNSMVNMIEMDA